MHIDRGDLTRRLNAASSDRREQDADLWGHVEAELRRLAQRYLRKEHRPSLLQTTMLVDDVFLELRAQDRVQWSSRTHFYAVAARFVRRALVDWARGEKRDKRGVTWQRVEIDPEMRPCAPDANPYILDLEEALTRLSRVSPRAARVVELKFFVGLAIEEIARALGVSARTVNDDWVFARAWLYRELAR